MDNLAKECSSQELHILTILISFTAGIKLNLINEIFPQAEEIAALNLAKYRQVQTNLAGAVERADVSEQALAKSRARSRASSLAPVSL